MSSGYEDIDFREGEGEYGDAPPTFSDSFESLTSKKHNIVNVKTLVNPVPGPSEAIGKSLFFTATPAVVHFGGLVVGKVHEQVVSVVNTSSSAQRMYVYNPSDSAFKTEYIKQGSLAPGMSQKITIKFRPTEYKYYHDYVRIQTDGSRFILIPLHAYPVLNKLEFPRSLPFGATPLCEPKTKVVTLHCSIPVDFSFDLEVVKPHPYYKVEPVSGIIPANGSIDINITFTPITLGSCVLMMLLHVGQYGWIPMECEVSAQAVSGLLESRQLKQAENRLMEYIKNKGDTVNETLGMSSSFRGNLTFQNNSSITLKPNQLQQSLGKMAGTNNAKFLQQSVIKSHGKDPTATLLASTYHAGDLNNVLDNVLDGPELIGTKLPNKNGNVNIRAIDGIPKANVPIHPSGPGAGNAFDAGSLWMSQKQREKNKPFGDKTMPIVPPREDLTMEGFRVPGNLDTFPAVNFLLTQEPGKLKPKDLKIAIEKSRAEREQRAEEQRKIQAEGGSAGQLDLRGILADERLNLAEGDVFKRQLREMAFLADVDDLSKQEAEKEFRVSEEFLGSELLLDEDIELVYQQRAQANHHKKVSEWRLGQARQHTLLYPPDHATIKAGAPAVIAKKAMDMLIPSFDSNRNDIWGKRMNTLRRFITLVSKWIFRKRLSDRMKKIKQKFVMEGCSTKEDVKEFIERENVEAKLAGPSFSENKKSAGVNSTEIGEISASKIKTFTSVASMLCDGPNDVLDKRLLNESIISSQRYEFTANMVRRVLFPKFTAEEAGSRTEMKGFSIDTIPSFDDQTFFPLKVRPEYVSMGYTIHEIPQVPISFPPARDKVLKDGAAEECIQRPSADLGLKYEEMKNIVPPDENCLLVPDHLKGCIPFINTKENSEFDEMNMEVPSWMTEKPTWRTDEVDFFKVNPNLSQIYVPVPRRSEMDYDWNLRPLGEKLKYDEDSSLRSEWIKDGGFIATNTYLLGCQETRSVDPPLPHGPTLSDTYNMNVDRHFSGLTLFSKDHLRCLDDNDVDIAPLQVRQDKSDELTDSESDDEDEYISQIPSLTQAKAIVRNTTSEDGKNDDLSLFDENERRMEQVELLRDRKILELEDSLKKTRYQQMDSVTKKLLDCSVVTKNRVSAVSFQVPFHSYEDNVIGLGLVDENENIPRLIHSFHEESDVYMNSPGASISSPMKI